MVDITIDNYEAFFLDFAEGNLSEAERHAVLQFVEYHPELKDELEDFEIISVAEDEVPKTDWSTLKKTELEAKEVLYFKAVENDLSESEKIALESLLKEEENQRDFKAWQLTKIKSGGEAIGKSELYQLGLVLPIGAHNYEHFLIAFGEGLLDSNKVELLKAYAATQADGERDLKLATSLQLKPAKGIFYPDKKSLYKKEKRIAIWWYRAAAIALLCVLGAYLYNTVSITPDRMQVAQQEEVKSGQNARKNPEKETVAKENQTESQAATGDELPEANKNSFSSTKSTALAAMPNVILSKGQETPSSSKTRETMVALKAQTIERIPVAYDQTIAMPKNKRPVEPVLAQNEQPVFQTTFKTLPELAEDAIASRFQIKEDERDEMASILAKRVSDKASEVLDSELSKETSDNGNHATYTFRFKNFKVQHTRNR